MPLRAVMLAAGVGRRLGDSQGGRPKVLLRFGGKTLLRRHLEILRPLGVADLTLCVGYRRQEVETELRAIAPAMPVHTVYNPDYRAGSVVSLWSVREALLGRGDVVLMDGDVLYDHRLARRLFEAPDANCFAMDRDVEPGEEAVMVCLREGRLVDFDKRPRARHDSFGEWVGFLRLSPAGAERLIAAARVYIEAGQRKATCESAIRDALLAEPAAFGIADVTGLPWIEIDFPEDVERAGREVLPRLEEPGA